MIKQASAGFVLWRIENGKRLYLLLHHSYGDGHWSFAKGRTEPGETLEQTARRELFEETGIRHAVIVAQLPEPTVYVTKDYDGSTVEKTLYLFVAFTEEKTVTLSSEHKDFEWLTLEEAVERATHEPTKQALLAADDLAC